MYDTCAITLSSRVQHDYFDREPHVHFNACFWKESIMLKASLSLTVVLTLTVCVLYTGGL